MNPRKQLLHEKYGGIASEAYWHDVERLEAGEPLDYIIGWTPFLGCTVDLSYRPLIPRTETEWWVEHLLPTIAAYDAPAVIDVGAGSGCIGTAVLTHVPDAHVTFVESEYELLQQIERTCSRNALDESRRRIIHSDLFAAVEGTFNVILANPPYIATASTQISAEVTAYEPHAALFSGRTGLRHIEQLIPQAQAHVRAGGLIAIECDPHQSDYVRRLLYAYGAPRTSILYDQFQRARVVCGIY
jgi:release factor glutamine methyltransferase